MPISMTLLILSLHATGTATSVPRRAADKWFRFDQNDTLAVGVLAYYLYHQAEQNPDSIIFSQLYAPTSFRLRKVTRLAGYLFSFFEHIVGNQ